MSETQAPAGATPPPTPPLTVNIQYIKDLSFEVPNAPAVFTQLRSAPEIAINIDVQASKLQDGASIFEVVLLIRVEATMPRGAAANGAPAPGAPVFVAELAYGGVFTLTNLPETAIEPVLLVECPRILFPFARNIVADTTRDGGFPPVLLQPIDFVQMWQARRQASANAGQPAPG
jgi:preprotein translocase subunit SecB